MESVYRKIMKFKGGRPLLFIDDLDDFITQSMSGQTAFDEIIQRILRSTPVVITSKREIPEKTYPVVKLHLQPFDLEATRLLIGQQKLNPAAAGEAYAQTKGNPLLLSAFIDSLKKKGAKISTGDLIARWLISEKITFLKMLEAACLVLSFDRELLCHITEEKINGELFQQFVGSPLVCARASKYRLNEPFGQLLREHLKKESPKKYLAYKRSALNYYPARAHAPAGREAGSYLLERLYLCENKTVRKLLFADYSQEYRFQPAAQEDFPVMLEMWQNAIQKTVSFPVTLSYDIKELLKAALPFIRVMKNAKREFLGFHAIVPVFCETFSCLCNSPVTSAYFRGLSPEEINRLRHSDLKTSDTSFILHFVPADGTGADARCALLRDAVLCCLQKSRRIVAVLTDFLLSDLALSLGFKIIPDTLSGPRLPLAELDLTITGIDFWLEWLVMERNSPPWLYLLLEFSKNDWKKHVRDALASLNNPPLLSENPLAPLAASLDSETTGHPEQKGKQGCKLRQVILETIDCLKNSAKNDFVLMAELLEATYVKQTGNRESIAYQLGLSPTTYYRWLSRARDELTGRLLEKAREKLNRRP